MENLIHKIANENNITNYKTEINSGSNKCDGFIAKLLKIDLVGENKTLQLIGKGAPNNKQYRKQIPVKLLYDNEIYFYEKVVSTFKDIQKASSMTGKELDLCIPKYFASNKTEYQEVLFLENLIASNYIMWDHRLINDTHINLVLNAYGKFHAYSFATKQEKSNLWIELIAGIEDVPGLFFSNSDFTDSVLEQCENVVQALRSRNREKLANKLRQFKEEKLEDVMNNSKRYSDKYSVIAHGDSWCNNYMFQYADKDNPDHPTSVKMIDFQVIRVGSPVIDISYLLYTCLGKKDLQHLDKYLKVYYSSLVESGQALHCDVNQVYPYEVFVQHWKKFCSYGFAMTLVVLHGMMSNKDEFPDFEDIFATGKGLFTSLNFVSVNEAKYHDRIIDIIEHLVNNDFL